MGKEVGSSKNSHTELKTYTDKYYAGQINSKDIFREAHQLLSKYGIRLRQKDGKDPVMTISIPKSCEGIVIGIRYVKNSGRNTEDHFLLRPNENIYKCKGKELGKMCPEYKGAHELQLQES
jgi:hypothetical protein